MNEILLKNHGVCLLLVLTHIKTVKNNLNIFNDLPYQNRATVYISNETRKT